MTQATKAGALLALLWALWPSAAKKKADKEPAGLPKRPEASKTPAAKSSPATRPSSPAQEELDEDDDGSAARIRERARLEQEQAKAAKKPKKPKAPEAPQLPSATEAQQRNADAADIAHKLHQKYIDDGEEPQNAAADALALYLLAGGNDPAEVKSFQRNMGVSESGVYDMETSAKIATLVDLAADETILEYHKQLRKGEAPAQAAALALAVYMEEALTNPKTVLLPPERISALQIQFMVPSGKYDDATKNELTKRGITPP